MPEKTLTPLYLDHFGLAEAPFMLTPNPRFLYLGAGQRDALAHLLYGLQCEDGFVAVSGEVGTGKTTLCRCLLEQLPAECDIALVVHPGLTPLELLATVCEQFAIAAPEGAVTGKPYIDRIEAYLREAREGGRRPILIIDEAQGLAADVLEQVRQLSNLETSSGRFLRILLVGQPELRDLLGRDNLRPLAQRIATRYHLGAFSEAESAACVRHRLAVAGGRGELFDEAALRRLHSLSGGIPRRLVALADRALLGAYALGQRQAGPETVARAAREVAGLPTVAARSLLARLALAGVGAAGSVAAAAAAYVHYGKPGG